MTNLAALQERKTVTVLGVNTGTSIDGLDLSIARIQQGNNRRSKTPKNNRLQVTPLMRRTVSFPTELRAELMQLASQQMTSLDHLALVDEALGEFIGRACRIFTRASRKRRIEVDLIASHGQTVRHHPEIVTIAGIPVRSTLQIGSPERIAAVTNRPVVSHFRQADTATGGEGAPITTGAVYQCLSDAKQSRLIVNIGGIANFFYLPGGGSMANTLAEDIGPGNLLLDQATQILFDRPFDKAGALAKSGAINEQLLQTVSKERFFSGSRAKKLLSTGREQYGARAIKKILKRSQALGVEKNSILTTLTELTALKIYQRLSPVLSADKRLRGIYLTGGGAKNTFLVKRLRDIFTQGDSSWSVRSVTELGMNPDSFEATCFAVLGWMCLHGVSAQPKSAPSKKNLYPPILGRIIQAPEKTPQ